jgi:MoaA/NifB/PqqE/SkfB family radical SAM enzyme
MPFRPEEVLFSPTTECNLACSHCSTGISRSKKTLSEKLARKFLEQCASMGIERVGFTGGEPFLVPGFVFSVVKAAVEKDIIFDRIMTNGVWWPGTRILKDILAALRDTGYDGNICVSVDAFHTKPRDIKRVAHFIRTAVTVWRRADIVSLACVTGLRDKERASIIRSLARLLGARVVKSPAGRPYIKSGAILLKVHNIDLAPTGNASGLKDPWDGKWFKEDHCKGPGNVFLVMPDGAVKPCCGYSSDENALTIGNIRRDSARDIMRRLGANRFASTIFGSGLGAIRKRLERIGVRFPGKTSSHCYFCGYVLNDIPKGTLNRCLDR